MKWIFTEVPESTIETLCSERSITPILAKLLYKRGLKESQAIARFLNPRLADLQDPFEIKQLEAGVCRLVTAIEQKETVYVVGDYDVDGVTSTALMVAALNHFDLSPKAFIPKRMEEGYGLSTKVIERILTLEKPDLLIVLDSGTSAVTEVTLLREAGIDVLIVDHHRPNSKTPEDCILINPCLDETIDPTYSNTLCSVGLTFKLVHGLVKKLRQEKWPQAETIVLKRFLDFVALGTIADVMPLQRENRIFVSFGLQEIKNTTRAGIRALLEIAGIDTYHGVLPMDVSYKLGPRINASGRLADAALPVEMLLSDNTRACFKMASQLDEMNRQRQEIEKAITLQAEKIVTAHHADKPGIVIYNPDWHSGVVGIIAGKLCRKYQRPAIVLGQEGILAKGSGRSVLGINLVEILNQCASVLKSWGGHPMAVGLSLDPQELKTFESLFCNAILIATQGELPKPSLEISVWVALHELNEGLLHILDPLHPFGEGNPEPVLGISNIMLSRPPSVFSEKHIRFQLPTSTGEGLGGIGWNMVHNIPPIHQPIDLAIKLYWNRWNGRKSLQVELIDWRFTA
jgi:single-stranded-DNA-specific exonuclease